MRATHNIVLASNNRHKLEEFRALFKNYEDVVVLPARDFIRNSDKLALLEKDESYLENAIIKARHGNSASHYPCLGDDSGLEISALDGKPGVRSARYAPTQVGLSQDQANLEKVLEELKGHPMNQRSARMICHLALVIEGILVLSLIHI